MRKAVLFLFIVILQVNAQPTEGIYKLRSIDSLLSKEVEFILDKRIADKRVIFLGEAEHHIGSDFLSKTQFIKYLVTKHGFRDIAFEGDFFALYHEHDQKNLFPIWSKSTQCQDLFNFLKEHNVTIWGFDNQFSSVFSFRNFSPLLFEFLTSNGIPYETTFKTHVNNVMKSGPKMNRELNEKEIATLLDNLDSLLLNSTVLENHFWKQALESFQSLVRQYNSNRKLGIEIRDRQMASNLNFLTVKMKDRKFLVWAANAHISKLNLPEMKNQTMGYQYLMANPNITYHIAFSSIKMPYRKVKFIEQQKNDPDNLLSLLPSLSDNYFIDAKTIKDGNISFKEKRFEGMFGLGLNKTNYFDHFDALIFIANGEKSTTK